MTILGDIATDLIKGEVTKVVNGFVTRYGLTPDQGTELVDGIMVALQVGCEMYEDGQKPSMAQ